MDARPSIFLNRSASTFIGPGDGAAPGAGCGNAVDIAVWNETWPSTFCMTWWTCPFRTDTDPNRFRYDSAGAVIVAPAPLGVDGPERDVREHDDRRAAFQALDVFFEPFDLLVAQAPETASLQIDDVDEANE